MTLEWKVSRGLGVVARAVGLVGHILEQSKQPMVTQLWHRGEHQATGNMRGKLRRK